ncbi:putative flagellar protein lafD [Yersinia frederiksenii]|nr:putative flagellar protein lafD [Yersinia frederiksenii]
MNGLALIEQLQSELFDVAQQNHWDAMPLINQRIDQLVTFLQQQHSVPQAIEQAMQQLQSRYQWAYQQSLLYQAHLNSSMAQLRQAQPGITAYAEMAITAYQNMATEEEQR